MYKFVPNFFPELPQFCIICGKLNKNFICDKCKKRIEKYEKYKLITGKNNIAKFLNCKQIEFDEFLYCFDYAGLIRKLLLKYKFSDCAYLGELFSKFILFKCSDILKKYDMIIPVPMDKMKKIKRGYNQTEIIVNILQKKLNNILIYNNLIKKQTKTQSTLNIKERELNVKDAFEIKNLSILKDKKIILFDDICTTGATVNEISRILKLAGVNKISVLVIAKD